VGQQKNSAVEAVPTPEENTDLLSSFLKMGILNDFKPCSLAGGEKAQKTLQPIPNCGIATCPEPAMDGFYGELLTAKNREVFSGKNGRSATGWREGYREGIPVEGYHLISMISNNIRQKSVSSGGLFLHSQICPCPTPLSHPPEKMCMTPP